MTKAFLHSRAALARVMLNYAARRSTLLDNSWVIVDAGAKTLSKSVKLCQKLLFLIVVISEHIEPLGNDVRIPESV